VDVPPRHLAALGDAVAVEPAGGRCHPDDYGRLVVMQGIEVSAHLGGKLKQTDDSANVRFAGGP